MSMAFSAEIHVPRSAAGMQELLRDRVATLAKAEGLSFISVSGEPERALELAAQAQALGVHVQVQLELSTARVAAESFLERAVQAGVSEVLLIGGAPGSAAADAPAATATGDAPADGFGSVTELVQFVVARFGTSLRVAVCGFPRGSKGELAHYSKDMVRVAEQVAAGAGLILTAPVWDVNFFTQYVGDQRSAGVPSATPILPALLPLHTLGCRADLMRLARHFGWTFPRVLAKELEQIDPAASVAALGAPIFSNLHAELKAQWPESPVHVVTLNSAAALDALRSIGALPPAAEGAAAADGGAEAGAAAASLAGGVAAATAGVAAAALGGGVRAGASVVHVLSSGTGLSLEIAELVAEAVSAAGLTPALASMDPDRGEGFKAWAAAQKLLEPEPALGPMRAVFIADTIEEERPSEGVGVCTRFLHRRVHTPGMLGRLSYAVLGLGDSNLLLDRQTTSAKDCNQVAQKLDARLAELGATAFCARGEADDRTGNQEIAPWLERLQIAMAQARAA